MYTTITINEFTEKMIAEVGRYLPQEMTKDLTMQPARTSKNQAVLHGISFCQDAGVPSPVIYVDDLYDRFTEGEGMQELCMEAAERYENSMDALPPVIPFDFENLEFENIKDRLVVRLLGTDCNEEIMKESPHVDLGNGLVLIAYINAEPTLDCPWSARVSNDLLRGSICCDEETLFAAALENTEKLAPAVLADLEHHMVAQQFPFMSGSENLFEEQDPDVNNTAVFILTNDLGLFGASVVCYPDVLRKAAGILGCGFYALPSSVHEFLLLPDSFRPDVKDLIRDVNDANHSVVEPQDLLSYRVFHYSPEDDMLRPVKEA